MKPLALLYPGFLIKGRKENGSPLLQSPPQENQAQSTADRLPREEEEEGGRAFIKEVTSKPGNL